MHVHDHIPSISLHSLGPCLPIDEKNGSAEVQTGGALVLCYRGGNQHDSFYKNVHYFMQRSKVQQKIDQYKVSTHVITLKNYFCVSAASF